MLVVQVLLAAAATDERIRWGESYYPKCNCGCCMTQRRPPSLNKTYPFMCAPVYFGQGTPTDDFAGCDQGGHGQDKFCMRPLNDNIVATARYSPVDMERWCFYACQPMHLTLHAVGAECVPLRNASLGMTGGNGRDASPYTPYSRPVPPAMPTNPPGSGAAVPTPLPDWREELHKQTNNTLDLDNPQVVDWASRVVANALWPGEPANAAEGHSAIADQARDLQRKPAFVPQRWYDEANDAANVAAGAAVAVGSGQIGAPGNVTNRVAMPPSNTPRPLRPGETTTTTVAPGGPATQAHAQAAAGVGNQLTADTNVTDAGAAGAQASTAQNTIASQAPMYRQAGDTAAANVANRVRTAGNAIPPMVASPVTSIRIPTPSPGAPAPVLVQQHSGRRLLMRKH
mmetsp:Transcript_19938/g.48542  ORF Transcript_19938/g.48542 Transcript_19938/m.48542 type:complete len:399 (+) Transcript_19938:139-1335(+)